MKTVLLVDGSNFLYRAFHGLPDLRTSAGEPTGAIKGFANMLKMIRSMIKPDYAACVFDAHGGTFRDEIYSQYKANRPPMPEDLSCQVEPIFTMVKAQGWPFLQVPGIEADDVIGTLAKQAEAKGFKVFIATGDKDMSQLVTDNVFILNTMTRQILDIEGVKNKFGVAPDKIIDYLSLMGDAVDNVPGITKCGPKTAAKWVNDFGGLDEIMQRAGEVKGKAGEYLREGMSFLPTARALVTIKTDADLSAWVKDGDVSSLVFNNEDTAFLTDFYARWEMQQSKKSVQRQTASRVKAPKVENLTANRIIEEFMIAANVAAALTLKNKSVPVMYRVHDRPQKEKLEDIKPLLQELKLKLPEAEALLPQHFNRVLNLCEKKGYAQGIGEMILRLQAQAKYTPKNIGHFGLGLPDYVHFTSPIRRYADLLIHRALVRVCSLPEGGGLAERFTLCQFEEIGNHLSETERRAVNAERDVTARLLSSYLVVMEGQILDVKVSGVSNAGVFVCVDCCGAEGLIPMSSLPDDDYVFVLGNMGLRGKFCGLSFLLGESCKAKLLEASPITGGLIFKYWDPQEEDGYYEKGNKGCALSTKKVAKKQKTIKNKKKIAQDSINNKLKTKKKSKKGEKKK